MRHRVLKRRSRPKCRLDSTRPPRHAVRVSAKDFKRLGEAVLERRAELGVSQEEFVRDVNMSVKTLQRIEAGREVRVATLGLLNRAAGWKAGSAQAVLAGGDPTLDEEPEPPQEPVPSREDLLKMADGLLEQAAELQRQIRRMEESA